MGDDTGNLNYINLLLQNTFSDVQELKGDNKLHVPDEYIRKTFGMDPSMFDETIKSLKINGDGISRESKRYSVDENGEVKDIKEPVLYIQNKKLAQTISKAYNIDYDISQKIVSMVSSETIRAMKEVNKNG